MLWRECARARTYERRVVICAGTGCVANGALKVHAAFVQQIAAAGLSVATELRAEDEGGDVRLSKSGCQGFCQQGPLVTIEPDGILYTRVRPEDVAEIIETTLQGGEVVDRLLYTDPLSGKHCRGTSEIPFYTLQHRYVLKSCGTLDPEDIREYIHNGGYRAAEAAFTRMTPEAVCEEVTFSGLRGRGGGGFPTGRKWGLTLQQPGPKKYVICNGDEGDPGAFMDRSLMEGNPHSVIEGMMIAARAIGADEGYIYVRAEYPLAVGRVRKAVADAEALGILGDNVFGTGHSFHIQVMEGAGAFVCGEETALISSIEGKRGMPTPKRPSGAEGLFGKPGDQQRGDTGDDPADPERRRGRVRAMGTEIAWHQDLRATGHVANTGLIEVPFGASLREIVHHIGGGVTDATGAATGEGFKAVQIGGPSGGCLTEGELDLPLDYDSLRSVGAMVGSGGLVVMNKQTCMVKIAHFFMNFTQNESCGKCVLCREGTKQMPPLEEIIEAGHARDVGSARRWRGAEGLALRPGQDGTNRCSRRCGISAPSTAHVVKRARLASAGASRAHNRPGALQG